MVRCESGDDEDDYRTEILEWSVDFFIYDDCGRKQWRAVDALKRYHDSSNGRAFLENDCA